MLKLINNTENPMTYVLPVPILLVLQAVIYLTFHFSIPSVDAVLKENTIMPQISLWLIPGISLAFAVWAYIKREQPNFMSSLYEFSLIIFGLNIIYIAYLNGFQLLYITIFWIIIFLSSLSFINKKRLALYLIFNFIALIVGVEWSSAEGSGLLLYFWFFITGLLLYYILSARLKIWESLKKSKRELHGQQQLLQKILEDAHIGIIMTNPEKRIVDANRQICKMLGYSKEELIGHFSDDLTAKPYKGTTKELMEQALKEGKKGYKIEKTYLHKNGSLVTAALSAAMIFDDAERHVITVGMIEDITVRKKAKKEADEYALALKESNKNLEEFAFAVSHDLKEPLRMISSYVQLLEMRYKDKLDESAKEYIYFASDGAIRLNAMIDDILTYSRLGRGEMEKKWLNMVDVMKNVKKNLYFKIEESQIDIISNGLPDIYADETQITLLIQNLISNAIKYRSKDSLPFVELIAKNDEKYWTFSIKDNGIGIAQEHQEKIFQIFKRLHGREEYKGTGIGLAICKRVIQRHKGKIWVESREGEGSEFYFTIPK